MGELHKDLQVYYETVDKHEKEVQKQKRELHDSLLEELETCIEDFKLNADLKYQALIGRDFYEILDKVLKEL